MAIQGESFFEAPVAQETSLYNAPEAQPFGNAEMTGEFEEEAGFYSASEAQPFAEMTGEGEFELGTNELGYTPEFEYAGEGEVSMFTSPEMSQEASYYSQPEWEYGEEANQLAGFSGEGEGEYEYEWEGELEAEADMFFGRVFKKLGSGIRKGITKVARQGVSALKRVAPMAIKSLTSMIPGVGPLVAPLAGQLVSSLVNQAEMEVAQMEQNMTNLFAQPEVISEAEQPALHEAALTELLAAEAAVAPTEAEAEANLAATLPITITIAGARPIVRRVMPTLTTANARLVSTLRRQGPAGRNLLRTVPAIQRRAVVIMKKAAQQGQPISAPLAVRAMTAATRRVLGDPRLTYRTIQRNTLMRLRTAPLRPWRVTVYAPRAAAVRRPMARPPMRRPAMRV